MLIITHLVKNLQHYAFSGDELFVIENCSGRRTQFTKKLSIQKVGRSKGYYINRRFRSLTSLRKRAYPYTKVILPPPVIPPF